MAEIRTIRYGSEPKWPASEEHASASRFYFVGGEVVSKSAWDALNPKPAMVGQDGAVLVHVVDCIGTPTAEEVQTAITERTA